MNVDPECICDICERNYCDECSYAFTLHYQFQGARCYRCADQSRINNLKVEEIRENIFKILFLDKGTKI